MLWRHQSVFIQSGYYVLTREIQASSRLLPYRISRYPSWSGR